MATRASLDHEKLLTPAEFAEAWKVCNRTIVRWGDAGFVTVKRTLGGHRRFLESETPAGRERAAAERAS